MKETTDKEFPAEDQGEDESTELTSDKVTSAEQDKWKKLILGIDNRKLLDYICSLCNARTSIGRADHEVSKKDKKAGEKDTIGSYDYNGPAKLKPIFPTEPDDPNEIG